MSDSHDELFTRELSHASRLHELRNLIRFLIENGMYNEAIRSRSTFKLALSIADEQKELEPSTTPLWKIPKEPR